MQSHSVKRVVSGALAASAVIAAVSFTQAPAIAAPIPAPQQPSISTSDALKKYRELAAEAEKLNQTYLGAKEDLAAKQATFDKATASLEQAKQALAKAEADKERFRQKVDQFAGASFVSGAQMNKLSALLSGNSAQDFLERSAALNVLAEQKKEALDQLSGAVQEAEAAKRQSKQSSDQAREAKDGAAKTLADIQAHKDQLDEQVAKLKEAAGLLSSADQQAQQNTGGPIPNVQAPGPAAQTAIDAALNQLGTPYVWGGESPGGFDCSGLTQWAFNQAGISLPRTASSQANAGTPVQRSQLQPGDLVYFYSPVTHIGIYIGDGKMVHAPTSGDVVKISSLDSQSSYTGATRVA